MKDYVSSSTTNDLFETRSQLDQGNDQGSTVEHQPVGKLVQQFFGEVPRVESSKPTQSKPNPICHRTVKPVEMERAFVEKGKTSHSQEIVGKRGIVLNRVTDTEFATHLSLNCERFQTFDAFYCGLPDKLDFLGQLFFANQVSLYGAVAAICEEFEAHQHRSGERHVLMGQSIVLSEIEAEVLLQF